MRKIGGLVALLLIVFCFKSYSQADISSLGFNYYALVRDTAGRVTPNKAVKLRFSILNGSNSSTPVYQETQNITTDAYGFANATIGNGVYTTGNSSSFSAIDFTINIYSLMVEVYNTYTQGYDPLAKQAMQAVPYAKVSYTSIYNGVPTGTIIAFGGDTMHIPKGWEICDGRAHSIADPKYVNLYNTIGTAWGSPSSGMFNVPKTQGLFLRGANNGGSWNPNGSIDMANRSAVLPGGNIGDMVGSYQGDAFQGHWHHINRSDRASPNGTQLTNGDGSAPADYFIRNPVSDGVNGVPRVTNETRPENVYVNYIIKL